MMHTVAIQSRLCSLFSLLIISFSVTQAQAGEMINSIGITMVDVPAGSFVMGFCAQDKKFTLLGETNCANTGPDAINSQTPQHRVNVKAFQIGKTEVTLGQFKHFIKASGRSNLFADEFMRYNAYGDSAPVVHVSWDDAQEFINWLNRVEGGGYRLPNEAEWEYACRAGELHIYCGGNDLDALGWYESNSSKQQQTVALKEPNAFYLHDMSGNAWEWVQDCWHANYADAPVDGSEWLSGCHGSGRVLRGGSWDLSTKYARAVVRINSSPGRRGFDSGFRLAFDKAQ